MWGNASRDHEVLTRRPDFEHRFGDVPRHFAGGGDLIFSHLAAAFSAVFPDGEAFFVRSVRCFRTQVTDAALARQVTGFIGQESMHGREHRRFNDRLGDLGYPTKRYERITRGYLAVRERLFTPRANLAATAALEHFTATLAELLLTSAETRELFGHPAVRDLFMWHALEECEHKAVAFDVYRAVGGSERTRVVTMNILRFSFLIAMTAAIILSLLGDAQTYRPGVLRGSWRRFRHSPLADKRLWAHLRDYNRPDFHPHDRDTWALVEHWRVALFGA
jgi:predicted metal-dependent hydrolase